MPRRAPGEPNRTGCRTVPKFGSDALELVEAVAGLEAGVELRSVGVGHGPERLTLARTPIEGVRDLPPVASKDPLQDLLGLGHRQRPGDAHVPWRPLRPEV